MNQHKDTLTTAAFLEMFKAYVKDCQTLVWSPTERRHIYKTAPRCPLVTVKSKVYCCAKPACPSSHICNKPYMPYEQAKREADLFI